MAKIRTDTLGSWYGGDNYLTLKQQEFNGRAFVNFFQNFSKYKWTLNSICAFLGNVSFESTCNPQLGEVGGSGYGIVQWTPKDNCIKRAKAIGRGNTYDTLYTQLLIIEYEVERGLQWIRTNDYPLSFKEFIADNEHDILWLTGAWLRNYERPADQSQSNINKRYNGDSSHIGSNQWKDKINYSEGGINGFLNWCKNIADDNSYLYKLGAGHGVPWNYSGKYFDCSSFVSFGLHNGGGYALETQFTTSNQKNELEDLGFSIMEFDKSKLQRGDIIFYVGHTEVIYSINDNDIELVGARTDELPPAEQISIHKYYDGEWTHIARPAGSYEPTYPTGYLKKSKGFVFCYNRVVR